VSLLDRRGKKKGRGKMKEWSSRSRRGGREEAGPLEKGEEKARKNLRGGEKSFAPGSEGSVRLDKGIVIKGSQSFLDPD